LLDSLRVPTKWFYLIIHYSIQFFVIACIFTGTRITILPS
jgi:hypothetical protein